MYLHFQDWTTPHYLSKIEGNGLSHGGWIIKVFADRESLKDKKPTLVQVESPHNPFAPTEAFIYEGNRVFTGPELEDELVKRELSDDAKDYARALFRFANREDLGFCQAAMSTVRDGTWAFDHPFADIDGLERAVMNPAKAGLYIHLDIFFPTSLERLRRLVDYDEPSLIMTPQEGLKIRRAEGQLKERK